jgi:hypothetical protein
MGDGLVLVWDIDQTLSGQYFDPNVFKKNPAVNPYDYVILNPKALDIIRKALDAKSTGRVSKIGIFTNNGDEEFISLIKSAIENKIGVEFIFDFIITANRADTSVGPNGQQVKSLQQIQEVLPSEKNLGNRVYFFDDMPDHVIRNEIQNHYIQITPPYVLGVKDATNWEPIETALLTKGGRRQRRRPTKKSRRRNKKRSRYSRSIRDGSS